jgi:hypothetical protein
MAYKEDLQASVAELVYGEPLRIPGQLLTPTAELVDAAHLITELCQHMACFGPVPTARHVSPSTFVHSDLERCTHIFLHQDTTRLALEPPLQRPLPGPITEREDCNFWCAGGLSLCQPTGSSRPTSSTGPTAGTTSTHQPQQPRPQHHQPRRQSPLQELYAPVVTSISSSLKHLSNHLHGGCCGNLPQCKTDNSHRVAKAGNIYTLQIVAWPWNIHTSATQPALIAKTRVVTG